MGRVRTKNGRLVIILASVVVGMVGMAYASVPLYRLFCQVTGYGGTPKTENVAVAASAVDAEITVRFDANVNSALPWRFRPEKRAVTVRLGETTKAIYVARNESDVTLVGTATFNVTPYKAAQYFSKIQCFCFTEQKLEPGQEIEMPVVFQVDPEILEDENARDVTAITLSYTFYRSEAEL